MLKMPPMAGPDYLRLLLGDVPSWRHGELLGVSPRTLRRWLAGDTEAPACAFQALYWHTRWGDSQLAAEYGHAAATFRGLVAARGAVPTMVDAGEPANDQRARAPMAGAVSVPFHR